jgi:hypothetical protein
MATTTLGHIIKEALETGAKRTFTDQERNEFYQDFYQDVAPKIEDIRNDQRRAFEEGKNLILA